MGDLRSVLSHSWAYRLFGLVIGAKRSRKLYLKDHIRPLDGMRVLDIGCGPATILELLPQVEYVGIDNNPDYIVDAKRKYGQRATFYQRTIGQDDCKDFCEFDLVLAIGLLHHLNNKEAVELLGIAKSALKPGGRLITLDGCYTARQSWFVRYLLKKDRGQFVRDVPAYLNLAQTVFPNAHGVLREDLLRIPYTHFILECSV